jgi:hypothetical protein
VNKEYTTLYTHIKTLFKKNLGFSLAIPIVTSFHNLEIEICKLFIQRFIVGFLFASDIVQHINNTKPKRAKKNSMIGSVSSK